MKAIKIALFIILLPDSDAFHSHSLLCCCHHSLPIAILLASLLAADALCYYAAIQWLLQIFQTHIHTDTFALKQTQSSEFYADILINVTLQLSLSLRVTHSLVQVLITMTYGYCFKKWICSLAVKDFYFLQEMWIV